MRSGRITIAVRLVAAFTLAVSALLAKPMRAWAEVNVADPRVVADSSMESGQVTTWDCVWLGSYPQSYVDDVATVEVLDEVTGWNDDGDIALDGEIYRRLRKPSDEAASYMTWSWYNKASPAGYCYFRWEPVKWRVLEDNGTTALVVADIALDCHRYENVWIETNWRDSQLREWLAGAYLSDCFTAEQRAAIVEQTVVNADNIEYGTDGGEDTVDQVFLLAESDVWGGDAATRHGFVAAEDTLDEARQCKSGDYANAMGAITRGGACVWFLRTPGGDSEHVVAVEREGSIADNWKAWSNEVGVRPALTVSLSSDQISYAGTVSSDGTVDEQAAPYSGGSVEPVDPSTYCYFTSGTATLSIGSAIAEGASDNNPARIDIDVEWDDAWFAADSSTYNHDLGIASSVLASAVYHDDDYSHGTYARDDLEALGFDMSTYECYYPHSRDDYKGRIDQVGYCFATKWIDGGETPLVAVLVRGTTKNVEWVSNFNIAEHTYPNDLHEGFSRANESLLTALRMYLAKGIGEEVDLGKVVFLVTGHSRGAAVANLLGHSLDEGAVSGSSGASEKDRVYVYTFASPNVSADYVSTITGDWGNIFNIVNPDDLVPKVALAKWMYGRYGVTKVLPSKSNMSPKRWNTYYHYVLQPEFSALTNNKTLECYKNGAQASNEFVDSMFMVAPTVYSYYNGGKNSGYDSMAKTLVPPCHAFEGVGNLLGDGSAAECIEALDTLCLYYPDLLLMLNRTIFKEVPRGTIYLPAKRPWNIVFGPQLTLLDAFSDAHTSETYIASMKALESAEFDFAESYRGLKVACPVDVMVYDEEGSLVCSIIDNVVDETVMANGLAASVSGDVKCVDIPSDGRYRVEISATDDGTMDVSYQERTAEGATVSQVSYADVPLIEGETYQASLSQDSDANTIQRGITLTSDTGIEVDQTRVVSGEEVLSINILVGVGEGDGYASGTTLATWGDPVLAIATPMEGAEFLGWYEDDALVSSAADYQFRAESDRTLVARFTSVPAKAPSAISLAAQTRTYTGKALAYSGKVTRSGSTGKVTYAYYSDAKCTKAVKAANVKAAGTYYVRATLAADEGHEGATSKVAKFTIAKAKNPLVVKGKSATVKLSVAKKKAQVLAASKVVAVTKAQGKRTYKVAKWTTAKAKKYITVNAKTGKVTVKKGTPKGTYQFKLEVKAAGNANYKAGAKTVAVKVVVK